MNHLTAFQQPHRCHSVAFTVDHLTFFQQPQNRFQQHVQKEQPKHLAYVLARIHDIDESLASILESGASAGAQGPGRGNNSVEILKAKLEQLEQQVQQYVRQGGASTVGGATGGSSQASGGAEASATADVSCMPFKFCSLMCVVWFGVFFLHAWLLSLSLSLPLSLSLSHSLSLSPSLFLSLSLFLNSDE